MELKLQNLLQSIKRCRKRKSNGNETSLGTEIQTDKSYLSSALIPITLSNSQLKSKHHNFTKISNPFFGILLSIFRPFKEANPKNFVETKPI